MSSAPVPPRPVALQVCWALLSLAGLVSVAVAASEETGPHRFVTDAFATPAARTVSLDLLVLGLAVVVFVVVEASRLGMRRPWLWAVLAVPLPGAFLVPLFLVLRERRLSDGPERQVRAAG